MKGKLGLYFLVLIFIPTTLGFQPRKALSINLDAKYLLENLLNDHLTILKQLQMPREMLERCSAVSSISELNMKGNPESQFYYIYNIDPINSLLGIDVFILNKNGQKLSNDTLIVLDFLIGELDEGEEIRRYNMSSSQFRISFPPEKNENLELLFFLNGWNDISLSGNVTHSLLKQSNVYTVNYLGGEGQSSRKWREGQDALLFTVVLTQKRGSVQKFKIMGKQFSVINPSGKKYFYGIKGTLDSEFICSFEQNINGVSFHSKSSKENNAFGLTFMPFPSKNFQDHRKHNSNTIRTVIIIISVFVGLIVGGVLIFFIYRKWRSASGHGFVEEDSQCQQVEESSKIELRDNRFPNIKYKMNTVLQVDEQLEGSLRGSCNPKVGGTVKMVPELTMPA